MTAGELAKRLRVKPSNLSPLISKFCAHGILARSEQGKHSFLKLTAQGTCFTTAKRAIREWK